MLELFFVVSYNSNPADPAVFGHSANEINISEWGWPSGGYCILKKGDCPSGFEPGYRFWDDEDNNNKNSYSGILPDGSYGGNTGIYFCCKDA